MDYKPLRMSTERELLFRGLNLVWCAEVYAELDATRAALAEAQGAFAQAQKRLEYYFTSTGEDRPSEFLDLEMAVIAGEAVTVADWISVIDKGIASAAGILVAGIL